MSNVQHITFARPEDDRKPKPLPPSRVDRHRGILQDQLRRAQKAPWCPSFSLAFRLLLFLRFMAAIYSNIQDCDEVFNFWEPLHYLDRGYGFQTWETSPVYAIRSYAYIMLYLFPAKFIDLILRLGVDKRPAFFAVRAFLALVTTACEAKFYVMVKEKVNYRVARYMLAMLLTSAGMWNASTAFLPSSFAMYFVTLAFAFAVEPPSVANPQRTLRATMLFATSAIVGWPFALALAIPFVFEELFMFSGDIVSSQDRMKWQIGRWLRLGKAGLAAALIFIPVIAIDTLAYGKLTIVPWNIIQYNIFSSDKGPELYGTEPWNFYISNLILNFNGVFLLAILSLPALFVTSYVDRKRLGFVKAAPERSSPFAVLAIRLAPLYLWLVILSAQPHKEERFMYPAYPLICFNAAVTLYLGRGWMEVAYMKMVTPYAATITPLFKRTTLSVILTTSLISFSRILALWNYYHAPMTVAFVFENFEMVRLLNTTGHIVLPTERDHDRESREPRFDMSPLQDFGLKLCIGKEWYRFPGSYLVPTGVRVDWLKSEFDGLLPGHYAENVTSTNTYWFAEGTKAIPQEMNDMNKEEPMHYTDVSSCDYLMDVDFPLHPVSSALEPRYVMDPAWEKVACAPFLDARHSAMLTRTFWLPGSKWQEPNEWGDYCVLKNTERVARKEVEMKVQK